ncbi:hypothetical protein [Ferrimonas balearica]|uniref:hypothetical protein n=1 Tax=Ferrimonas balearica TaxID=44012 RepID=UPI001C992E35|nr:hypothetical protein [Ferrimonas balearica]MBY5920798.1 hypothetical protein [Ferrimonas balearica]MBY5996517.1 hypothetical protein [Ferrimonas balearica]
MSKLALTVTLLIGLLFGAVGGYALSQKLIIARGGGATMGFVPLANQLIEEPEVRQMTICAKLAMNQGQKIDNLALNLRLNRFLMSMDDGSQRPFFALIFAKAYLMGLADSLPQSGESAGEYRCDELTWLYKVDS